MLKMSAIQTSVYREMSFIYGAPVSSGSYFQADGMGLTHPLFGAYLVAVESCLTSNCGEFAIIRSRDCRRSPICQETQLCCDFSASPG